jgi:hypothetical protein
MLTYASFRRGCSATRICVRMIHTPTCDPERPATPSTPNDAALADEVVYEFRFEALGMPATKGYGWAQLKFGERIGLDLRYTVARKLGWGMHSSIWLARDSK